MSYYQWHNSGNAGKQYKITEKEAEEIGVSRILEVDEAEMDGSRNEAKAKSRPLPASHQLEGHKSPIPDGLY